MGSLFIQNSISKDAEAQRDIDQARELGFDPNLLKKIEEFKKQR